MNGHFNDDSTRNWNISETCCANFDILVWRSPFQRQWAVSYSLKDSGNLLLNRIQSGLGAENIFSYLLSVEKRPCWNSFLALLLVYLPGRGNFCHKPFSRERIHWGLSYMVRSGAQFNFASSFQQCQNSSKMWVEIHYTCLLWLLAMKNSMNGQHRLQVVDQH